MRPSFNIVYAGFLWVLLSLCASSLARAQDKAPELQVEYDKLIADFNVAQEEYYRPLEAAKTDAERALVELDPAQDPLRPFAAKFEALAVRAKGSDTGCNCWIWVLTKAYDDKRARIQSNEQIAQAAQEMESRAESISNVTYSAPTETGDVQTTRDVVGLLGGGGPSAAPVPRVGRNEPCPCGSGKKYKQCHGKLA